MKIYTKTGDTGMTTLFGGTRVPKHHLRIETYGTIDELNSYIGLLKDQKIDRKTGQTLLKIQNELFTIGAMLATPPEKEILKNGKKRLQIHILTSNEILYLEHEIDTIQKELSPMTHFILPGGHQTVSFCHIARCVCRRAERLSAQLNENETITPPILSYLNRLSDYLFVLARKLTIDNHAKEILWIPKNESL